jgi:hypothetical protein
MEGAFIGGKLPNLSAAAKRTGAVVLPLSKHYKPLWSGKTFAACA